MRKNYSLIFTLICAWFSILSAAKINLNRDIEEDKTIINYDTSKDPLSLTGSTNCPNNCAGCYNNECYMCNSGYTLFKDGDCVSDTTITLSVVFGSLALVCLCACCKACASANSSNANAQPQPLIQPNNQPIKRIVVHEPIMKPLQPQNEYVPPPIHQNVEPEPQIYKDIEPPLYKNQLDFNFNFYNNQHYNDQIDFSNDWIKDYQNNYGFENNNINVNDGFAPLN